MFHYRALFNSLMKPKSVYGLFFLALTASYLSLSPGAILGMGYTQENATASNQIISNLGYWVRLQPAQIAISWPRHGLFELLFEMPFLMVAHLFFGTSEVWADRILSLQPVLITSLLCTVILVWARRITSSLTWGYVLAMIAALSTMLWPYAYIGLETTQSLFVLLSGYLALGSDSRRTWPHALLFAFSCGFAVGVKSNGIFLAPAIAFLCLVYARGKSPNADLKTIDWKKIGAVVVIIIVLYELSAYTRHLSPTWSAGTLNTFRVFSAGGPVKTAFNALALVGSANKGLLVYCPVLIIALLGLRTAYSKNAQLVIFASLTLAGLVGGCSLIFFYADETWGPRYLHSAIAPLFICLAASKQSIRFRLRKELPLITLAVLGVAISFLGAFYYYGAMHQAATRTGQDTIEALQNDPNWNHIRFNLLLLQVWNRGGTEPAPWAPTRHWWYEQPPDAPPLKTINLRDLAAPQPSLVRGWAVEKSGSYGVVWYVYLGSFLLGIPLLVWLGFVAWRQEVVNGKAKLGESLIAESIST